MERAVANFFQAISGLGLHNEIIGVLAALCLVLIGANISTYVSSKKKDVHRIDEKIGGILKVIEALERDLKGEKEKVHSFEKNIITLGSDMKRNSIAISQLKDQEERNSFKQDAQLVELTEKMHGIAQQMTNIVLSLKEQLNVK